MLFGSSPEISRNYRWNARDVARVLKAPGREEQANRLIAAVLEGAVSYESKWDIHLEASLHAIAGDDQKALVAMGRFLERGGSPYDLMSQPDLKRFETKPEYKAMAEK